MFHTTEQRRFARRLTTLDDGDLFELMRVVRHALRPTAKYHLTTDDSQLWKSLAVEAEIIRRHPIALLEPFREWLRHRDDHRH